jgi:hypothetical protein
VPVIAVVALGLVGFWTAAVKPLGPVHAYVAPLTVEAVKFKVAPGQTGPLFPAVGAEGRALTVAAVVPAAEVQPPAVAVTL